MNSYDFLAPVYDPALSWLYRRHRAHAASNLQLQPGSTVLVPGCGTGQDFEFLVPAVGSKGKIVGVDFSAGMLDRAQRRVRRQGWSNVELHQGDVRSLGDMDIGPFDRVLFFLTLSVLPDWRELFGQVWEGLEIGGRCTVFDVYANRRVAQSKIVEWIARADLSRRTWEPLLERSPDAHHQHLPGSSHIHGGQLHLCTGSKPEPSGHGLAPRS